MKFDLSSPKAKIIAASTIVLAGSVIGIALNLGTGDDTVGQSTVQNTKPRQVEKQLTPQEKDELHSSWLFSTSESAVLVDQDNGLEMATIGR